MDNHLSLDDRLVDDNVIKLMFDNFVNPPQWMNEANCVQNDLTINDLKNNSEYIKEKYCKNCPVIKQCYNWGEKFGAHSIVYGNNINKEEHND